MTRPIAVSSTRVDWLRRPLAALCLFAGLTSIAGGAQLILRPDGSIIRAPLSLLDGTPFQDFMLPGLLLAGFVGVSNTLAGALVLARHPLANGATLVAGGV